MPLTTTCQSRLTFTHRPSIAGSRLPGERWKEGKEWDVARPFAARRAHSPTGPIKVSSALAPCDHRVLGLVDESFLPVNRHYFTVLNLDHRLRQADLANRIELNPTIQALEIHVCDRITHLCRVGGPRGFERLGIRFDNGDRGSRVVVRLIAEALLIRLRELFRVTEIIVLLCRRRQP